MTYQEACKAMAAGEVVTHALLEGGVLRRGWIARADGPRQYLMLHPSPESRTGRIWNPSPWDVARSKDWSVVS